MSFLSYDDLLAADLESERFVQQGLRLLEWDFRQLSLLALADWERLNIAEPKLFPDLAALQRPSWGTWNGLLGGLKEARKTVLRTRGPEERARLETAATLDRVLAALEEPVGPDWAEALQPLGQFTRNPIRRRTRLGVVLTLPIRLRNRVAHDVPADPEWWQNAAAGLKPLLRFHARRGSGPACPPAPPWLLTEDGDTWAFNGLEEDLAALYVSRGGKTRPAPEQGPAVLLALKRLLGKTEAQEKDFRKLLARLAPEDLKGVLLGDYLLSRPVGAGGFATVHAGRQLSTGRKVALKVLHDGMPEDVKQRFQQEAEFLSRFNHPHIVGLHGYGEEPWTRPRPFSLADEEWYQQLERSAPVKSFLALEWVEGKTLEQVIQGGPASRPSVRELVGWMTQAANALAAVHALGLVHRDVKPSNLMVTPEGAIKLMDFGVAGTQDEVGRLSTETGRALGTRAYMAPEQLRPTPGEAGVGPSADLYALCATFYEVCSGARLYRHDTEAEEAVRSRKLGGEKPAPPSRHAPDVPWEVEVLLLGGLEAEITDRPRSMETLEHDLQCVLADEPIEYRRPGVVRRLRLAYRRNRAIARLSAAFALAAVVGLTLYIFSITAARKRAEASEARAVEAREDTERLRTDDRLARAAGEWDAGRPVEAERLLDELPFDERHWDWRYLKRRCHQELLTLQPDREVLFRQVRCLAYSPDGRSLATGGDEPLGEPGNRGAVRIVEADTGKALQVLAGHTQQVEALAYSPDGKRLASAGQDAVRVWDLAAGGKERLALEGTGAGPSRPVFRPDLGQVAQAGPANTILVRDLAAAAGAKTLRGQDGPVNALAYSPDGRRLASADGKVVRVWDLDSGAVVHTLHGHLGDVTVINFRPDGKQLASGDDRGEVLTWDCPTGALLHVLPGDGGGGRLTRTLSVSGRPVAGLRYSPDSRLLAAAGADRVARVWEADNGKSLLTLEGHPSSLIDLAFRPDSRRLATVDLTGVVKVWLADRQPDFLFFRAHTPKAVNAVCFTPGGGLLVSGGADGTVQLRDPATGEQQRWFPNPGPVWSVACSPDGRLLASGGAFLDGSTLLLWDLASGRSRRLRGHEDLPRRSPQRRFRTRMERPWMQRWFDTIRPPPGVGPLPQGPFEEGRDPFAPPLPAMPPPPGPVQPPPAVGRNPFAPPEDPNPPANRPGPGKGHGHKIPSCDDIEAPPDEKPPKRPPGDIGPPPVERAPRESDAGAPGKPGPVPGGGKVPSPEALFQQFQAPTVVSLAFIPDGQLLASASADGVILWDPATDARLQTLDGAADRVAFSPDGKLLATGGDQDAVLLWDVGSRQKVRTLAGHTADLTDLAFSSDGRLLASAGADGIVRLWDVGQGVEQQTLLVGTGTRVRVAFSRDNRVLITADGAGRVKAWDRQTGQEVLSLRKSASGVEDMVGELPGPLIGPLNRNLGANLNELFGNWLLALEGTVAFSDDGRRLAWCGPLGGLAIWDVPPALETQTLRVDSGAVRSVGWGAGGRLVTTVAGKTVKVWDADRGRQVALFRAHAGEVNALAHSPDGVHCATAGEDGTARVWEAATGTESAVFKDQGERMTAVAFDPSGKVLASAGGDGTIELRRWQSDRELRMLRGYDSFVLALAFSPDGRLLASGHSRGPRPGGAEVDPTVPPTPEQMAEWNRRAGEIKVWDTASGQELCTLRAHQADVAALAFTPDGSRLLSSGTDGTVKVWDLAARRETVALPGSQIGLALCPDGKLVATASQDVVKLWDVSSGEEVRTISGHIGLIGSLAFSPDGRRLLGGALLDGTVEFWDLESR